MLIALAIIHKNGQILIGRRKEKDPYAPKLTWVFPGGKIDSLPMEDCLKKEVKEETNLKAKVRNIVSARKHPDANIDIIAIYFDCTAEGVERAGSDLAELKWVPATQVLKYFTTSVSEEVTKFLREIEEKNM